MKEFLWNNLSLNLFSDNSSLYLAVKNKLEDFSQSKERVFLRDIYRIYTRENLTTDYLSLKLVGDNIPSLYFEVTPYRTIAKDFLNEKIPSEIILSDLASILLIERILVKEKKILASKKVLRQLAGDIFKFWKDSFISLTINENKIPNNIREEYGSVIRKFVKVKGNKKIEIEYLYEAYNSKIPPFLTKKEAKEKFGEEIILYGMTEIDPLHFKILEKLSGHVKISFYLSAPRLKLIVPNDKQFKLTQMKEVVPEWSLLAKFLGNYKLPEIEKEFNFPFLSIPQDANFSFYESQEAYREIEFVGREILRLVEKNKDNDDFKLTSIKLILPPTDMNYLLLVGNAFERMGIPHSFTKDIRKKKAPYFSAVGSILKLALSDFDKDSAFSLFYNPCFFPALEEMRIPIKADIWNQIISRMNLSGFLDKEHKKNKGFRESRLMTWENLWSRLNSILIGDTGEDSIVLESDEMEEAFQFLQVSSSLLQDLIGLKEDFSTLNDFAKFFKIILDTYLHPSMRQNKSDEIERLNNRGKEKILNFLNSIEAIESELTKMIGDKSYYSLDDFSDILLAQMESWTEGDSKVLKQGVVIAELVDAVDPSFDYIFLVGLDERKFSINSGKHESIMIQDSFVSNRKDSALKLKNYFYHIFNQKAKNYFFSYVSLDTIKDREFYPARELEIIRNKVNENSDYKKIPLFTYLEYKMDSTPIFEQEAFDLIGIKQKEASLNILKNSYPDWEDNIDNSLLKEIDSITKDKLLNKRIKTYFYRKDFDNEDSRKTKKIKLSVNKFLSYLECPKKFFFEYSIETEEEIDTIGELETVDSLSKHVFIKEALNYLKVDLNLTSDEIIEKIFNFKRIEGGEIPFGMLGKLSEIEFKKYLDNYLIPFAKEKILNQYRVEQNAVFYTEASKTKDSIIFSTPTIWNEFIKAKVDFLLLEGDILYITLLTTSKEIANKKKINIGLTTYLLNQSAQIREELNDFFQVPNIQLRPAILHFPKNKPPTLNLGKLIGSQEVVYRPFWDSLAESKYPSYPKEGNVDICKYCPVNTVCHGYQNGFRPFLEKEMLEVIELGKNQFA